MGLDDLVLTPGLMAKWYEKSLVDSGREIAVPTEVDKEVSLAAAITIPATGNNAQHILVINFDPIHRIISDRDLELLTNILSACKLGISDIAIVNAAGNNDVTADHLHAQFTPRIILFAGSKTQDLGYPVQFPMFKIQRHDGRQYLSFPSFAEMSKDKESKAQLWMQLKQLFGV